MDSPLEGDGFEPSVPATRTQCISSTQAAGSSVDRVGARRCRRIVPLGSISASPMISFTLLTSDETGHDHTWPENSVSSVEIQGSGNVALWY
jgi:hypothetical protein